MAINLSSEYIHINASVLSVGESGAERQQVICPRRAAQQSMHWIGGMQKTTNQDREKMKIEIKNCTDCGKHRIGNSGIYCIDYPGRHIDKTIPEWCSHKKVKSSV